MVSNTQNDESNVSNRSAKAQTIYLSYIYNITLLKAMTHIIYKNDILKHSKTIKFRIQMLLLNREKNSIHYYDIPVYLLFLQCSTNGFT